MPDAAVTRTAEPLLIGRYAMFDEIASGGMATVHIGRLLGAAGFQRTIAIKRLHAYYLKDQEFVSMFMDEARIVARIRHPNVVAMSDVVQSAAGMFLVMEYVHGESLSNLLGAARARQQRAPYRIAARVVYDVLLGLHAAHETRGDGGAMLGVVHRDVSPQNIMVGTDGVARVLDFGVAKAAGRAQSTHEGQIKGKLAYMAPEQIRGAVDRRTDVFSASVVLWEALAGRRLHEGMKDVDIVSRVVRGTLPVPSTHAPDVPPALDAIVARGLAKDPAERYADALELARELEAKVGLASAGEVAAWVDTLAREAIAERAAKVAAMEHHAVALAPAAADPASLHASLVGGGPPVRGAPFGIATPSLPGGFSPVGTPDGEPSTMDVRFDLDVPFAEVGASAPSSASPPEASTPSARTPLPRGRHELRPYVVGVAVCAALALVGAALGTYALFGPRGGGRRRPDVSELPVPPGAVATPAADSR